MKYKIVEILKTFSQEEIKSFRDYLISPFFHKSQKLVKLYEELIIFYPLFQSIDLTEAKLSKKMHPHLPYNRSTMKVLLFDLANAAEHYLMLLNFQKKEIESQDFLRDELFKRRLNKCLEQNLDKTNLILKDLKNIHTEHFLIKFKLFTDMINYFNLNKSRSNSNKISFNVNILTERGKYITYFFVKEMIREYENLQTLNKNYNISEEKNFIIQLFRKIDFSELIKFLVMNSENKFYSKIFEMYLALFNSFSDLNNEKNYFRYKKLLLNNLKYLGMDEIRFHFGRLIRYCMMKGPEKELYFKYQRELFNIYKYILFKGYYKSSLSDYIPIELFKTILLLGLNLKKYKWTLNFIKKYRHKLHPERRNNMYYYSCAKYYFHRGRYEEAMRNFHKIELNHFMLKIDLKNLMLMTFYELELFENALSLVDAYKHFLSKDKILASTERRKYKNFVSIVQKMVIYKTSFNPMTKYVISKCLSNDLPHRDWIDDKFKELDTRYTQSA